MADYAARLEVGTDADELFHYLSDVSNLPRYFPRMTSAQPGDGDEVRVTAQLGDRRVEGNAWFKVDNAMRALSWGSEGPNDYHGRLQVSDDGLSASVSVTLSTTRADGPEIQRGLEETLHAIKDIAESAG